MPYGHEEEISMNKDTIKNIDARQVRLKVKLITGGAAGKAIRKPVRAVQSQQTLCLLCVLDHRMMITCY